jgi:hypothetical protein
MLLQRKCACGGSPGLTGECAGCRRKRILGRLQTKLAVNAPGDPFEQEADRVAEEITRLPTSPSGLDAPSGPAARNVQRHVPSGGSGLTEAPPVVTEALRSSGQAMDSSTRAFFEARFGHDFSRVRIHSDSPAAESVQAHAFTVGSDIVFAAGRYAPATVEGRRLLGHELTHVVQQGAAAPSAPSRVPRLVSRQLAQPAVQRKPALPYKGVILSLDEIKKDPRREKLRKQSGQSQAKVCRSIGKVLDRKNCPTSLDENAEVTVTAEKVAGLWLRIDCAGIPGFGPVEPCHVLGAFVKPKAAPPAKATKPAQKPQDQEEKDEEPEPDTAEPAAAPEGKNVLADCTSDQATAIQEAVSQALADLDGAIDALSARPLSEHAQHALFLAFRASDDAAADDVLSKLRAIRNGLPTVGIQCEQDEDILFGCTEDTAAYTNLISGVIHLCMSDWDASDPVTENPRTLVHEGAHAFAGAPTVDDPYFDHTCDETEDTSGHSSEYRLGKADPIACVVYHLRHRTAESAKSLKELHSGEALKRIVQSRPTGPISLSAAPEKPFFLLDKAPVAGGFTYRWRLYDDADRHYLLRGEENDEPLDWLSFTDQSQAIIGRKTRDLLAKRGVTKGTIKCTIRLPDQTETTLSLDLEFAP